MVFLLIRIVLCSGSRGSKAYLPWVEATILSQIWRPDIWHQKTPWSTWCTQPCHGHWNISVWFQACCCANRYVFQLQCFKEEWLQSRYFCLFCQPLKYLSVCQRPTIKILTQHSNLKFKEYCRFIQRVRYRIWPQIGTHFCRYGNQFFHYSPISNRSNVLLIYYHPIQWIRFCKLLCWHSSIKR